MTVLRSHLSLQTSVTRPFRMELRSIMSQFSVDSFPDDMSASELPLASPLLNTRRGRRAQLEGDAALGPSESSPPVRTTFVRETDWGVVFSDESRGAGTDQGLF